MMAWCGRPPGPMGGGRSPGLKRANPELDNDVGYGPRNPADVMGYPGGPFLKRQEKDILIFVGIQHTKREAFVCTAVSVILAPVTYFHGLAKTATTSFSLWRPFENATLSEWPPRWKERSRSFGFHKKKTSAALMCTEKTIEHERQLSFHKTYNLR